MPRALVSKLSDSEIVLGDCDLCGVKIFHRRMYRVVVTSTLDQRQLWLDDVRDTAMVYFPAELIPEKDAVT